MFDMEKVHGIPAVTLPRDGSCWYDAGFLGELRRNIEKLAGKTGTFIAFRSQNPNWSGNDAPAPDDFALRREGFGLKGVLLDIDVPAVIHVSGECRDGLCGLFLACDVRLCCEDGLFRYTRSHYAGEIASLKNIRGINPLLFLNGLKQYGGRELYHKGVADKLIEESGFDEYLRKLSMLNSSSLKTIKELSSAETWLSFEQGNRIERALFALKFAEPGVEGTLMNFFKK